MNKYYQSNIHSIEFIENCLKLIAYNNQIEWKDSFLKWEFGKKNKFDFSTSLLLAISFKTKKKFSDIFLEVKNAFEPIIDSIEISEVNGYLNFFFKSTFYKNFFNWIIEKDFIFPKRGKIVNVEFASINPTGYLHIGHLRNAVIGNSIANIYEFFGFEVVREYYINDRGKQIDDLIGSVISYSEKLLGNIKEIDSNVAYKGKSIEDSAFYITNHFKINEMKLSNFSFRQKIIDFFINKIKIDLEKLDIYFDNWFSENEMYLNKEEFEKTLEFLSEKDFVYKSDGAIFLKTSKFGDEKDRVIVKNSGKFTYFLSDILYHLDKKKRSDIIVDVWGSDHHGYIDRLKSALRMFNHNDVDNFFNVILIQMVSLTNPEGEIKKLSKRFVNLMSISDIENLIDIDLLKFYLLETDHNNHVFVNMNSLNNEVKNSKLHYIQYAHARCKKILSKWEIMSLGQVDEFLLNDRKEKKIFNNLMMFLSNACKALEQKKPYLILKYAHSISLEFHTYYQSIPILKSDNLDISRQRVALTYVVKKILAICLKMLSIEPVDDMH